MMLGMEESSQPFLGRVYMYNNNNNNNNDNNI